MCKLAFDEEFNESSVSGLATTGGAGSQTWYMPAQWWSSCGSTSNLALGNGALTINGAGCVTGIASAPANGSTTSNNNWAYKYGYWEASFTRPDCKTNSKEWTAWWLLASPATNAAQNTGYSGEIDIFEGNYVGGGMNTGSGTYHVWSNGNSDVENNNNTDSYSMPSSSNCTAQTVYGLLWTQGRFEWYVNNQLVNSSTYSSSNAKTAFDGNLKYYMILDRQDGASSMALDYVRVWQSGSGSGAPSITTTSAPGGTVGTAYSQTLTATGGVTPYTWSLSSGTLPAGLSLNTSGTISGTPTAAGTSSFTVKVTDAANTSATQNLSITIAAGSTTTTSSSPKIATTSLPGGATNVAYSQTLSATGGTSPYKWSLSSGALPAGLSLSTSGTVSGTPTATGTASFTVKVTDAANASATQNLSVTIAAGSSTSTSSPKVNTTTLPNGTTNVSYSQTLSATGGTSPYTWSLGSGALPAGLSLSTSGKISGTPTASGTTSFTVNVKDSTSATATANLAITVNSYHRRWRY